MIESEGSLPKVKPSFPLIPRGPNPTRGLAATVKSHSTTKGVPLKKSIVMIPSSPYRGTRTLLVSECAGHEGEEEIVKSCLSTIGLGIAVFTFFGFQPAEAGCELIHATHSARSQAKAVETSQALALQSAYDLQRARGWSHITLSAHPVQGDPFWKAVRPNGVPAHARLKPDLVTPQFYTTCFTGVVVPYVCTTGSSVCGQ
jgi:hypothetical protein